jgi:tetratricopeptide (TPR) repeat protein
VWQDNPVSTSTTDQRAGAGVSVDRDFFVSFTGADQPWAAWLLAELDAAGYSSVSQLRDFVAGSNFVTEMHRAARRARRTLGVLSPQALRAPFVWQEWAQRLAADPTGGQRALVLVRVERCEPEGLLGPVVYVDLVGLDEADARVRLREELDAAVRGHRLTPSAADFPGSAPAGVVADVARPRFPTALPPVWNVPYRRNPAFTGREQVLADLAGRLGQGAAAAVTQALQGAGGVGKTALAVEYAYRHRSEFDAVWWVRAEEPTTLVSDLADLAVALGLTDPAEANQQLAVLTVRRWLDDHDRWLLILDNAQAPDTPTGLEVPLTRHVGLIPQVLHGQVLVTSRDARWEQHAALAELEVFSHAEAVAFLLARSGATDEQAAAEIAELLGWLPLALEQAGAYVRETQISLRAYRTRLEQAPGKLLRRGAPRDRDPADTLATTWQLSLDQVATVPCATTLLELCAFLAPDDIPRTLLERLSGLAEMPAELAVLAEDALALDEAVGGLWRFGLLKASPEVVAVHRLVQQVVRDQLGLERRRELVEVALRLLQAAFPNAHTDPDAWHAYAQLLPHALAVTGHSETLDTDLERVAWLLTDAGLYLWQRADHPQARALLERALAIREAHLGADHPQTVRSLGNLALVLRAQGDLQGARTLHERALAILEARLGADHPDTVRSRQNLAAVVEALDEQP